MIGGIAGQGGFDPKGKTIKINNAGIASTSYVDLVSITGSGYLISVSTHSGYKADTRLRVVVDGVEILNGRIGTGSTESAGGGDITFMIKFSTSLLIQLHSGNASYSCHSTSVCLLD